MTERWTRRHWLRMAAAGLAGASTSGWIEALADDSAHDPKRKRSCILLWMNGGPSQIDTFDPKPGHTNAGQTKAIATNVPGLQFAEHLPKMAQRADHLCLLRGMSTKEGDHGRATYLMRTGYVPSGPISYPTLGSLIAKEFENPDDDLPPFVSIAPYKFFNPAAYGPGFLGPKYAPFVVGDRLGFGVPQGGYEQALKVEDLNSPSGTTRDQEDERLELMGIIGEPFHNSRPDPAVVSHALAYRKAVRLMRSEASSAFDLEKESAATRDAYGRTPFGQGCLLARRLVERGVPFVEVTLGGLGNQVFGWDTHFANHTNVQQLCGALDPAWAALIDDLKARGLLETTMIVWMGEFGRTPRLNPQGGRDHYPNAWSTVLAGGGIRGGQAIGDTGKDGLRVQDKPMGVPDLFATVCRGLGLDPSKQNMSDVGRPIRLADPSGKPIAGALA